MPRELTRQSVEAKGPGSGLDFTIRQHDMTVWVTLSGIVDRPGLSRLTRRVGPLLRKRGCRIVLDGRSLEHIDYRTVPELIGWSRHLRAFGHRLYLSNWRRYLKAILCVEDWDRELDPEPVPRLTWEALAQPVAGPTP